jgi:hypothetical protein
MRLCPEVKLEEDVEGEGEFCSSKVFDLGGCDAPLGLLTTSHGPDAVSVVRCAGQPAGAVRRTPTTSIISISR